MVMFMPGILGVGAGKGEGAGREPDGRDPRAVAHPQALHPETSGNLADIKRAFCRSPETWRGWDITNAAPLRISPPSGGSTAEGREGGPTGRDIRSVAPSTASRSPSPTGAPKGGG